MDILNTSVLSAIKISNRLLQLEAPILKVYSKPLITNMTLESKRNFYTSHSIKGKTGITVVISQVSLLELMKRPRIHQAVRVMNVLHVQALHNDFLNINKV